jgi:hypothetical protein
MLIGGKLAGYSFVMLTVGPFKWVREQGRVRWRWNTSLNTFGGLALMVPPVAQSESRRMARFILLPPVTEKPLADCANPLPHKASMCGPRWTARIPHYAQIRDFIHANEYPWDVATALWGEDEQKRRPSMIQHTRQLLAGETPPVIAECCDLAAQPTTKAHQRVYILLE